MTVIDGDRVGLGPGLALIEEVDVGVTDGESPAENAGAAAGRNPTGCS